MALEAQTRSRPIVLLINPFATELMLQTVQGRWQHGGEVGPWSPSGLTNNNCKWDICVPLVTSALDEGGWSTPRPSRFTPEKEARCPL